MQGYYQLALSVMAGQKQCFRLSLVPMGKPFRVYPALRHSQADTVGPVSGNCPLGIANNCISNKIGCRMFGAVVVRGVRSCGHFKMNINVLVFQCIDLLLHCCFIDELHLFFPPRMTTRPINFQSMNSF